ncbi:hypothetical protein MF271_19415 (plasmid) [Deinococcus sp. KNUC1210]|uniref:hypothetical protein n=1 Tax=Deinococcus sp. KNUC1210 TaxID=2917691 RepID=UPI001EF11218|nr:hypothetical protein [Deinococcus sp. KNUC1210]ULH17361.1 hypothetical protein MF271_19415 [Deinococcus sp. KNUC1210]
MVDFFREVLSITPWSGENGRPGQLEILQDMQQSICDQLDGKENVPFIFLGEAAHGLGKTYVLEAGVLLYFHECFPPASGESSMVLSTAPTAPQVNDLLWKDVRKLIEMASGQGHRIGQGILPSEARINKSGTHFAVGRTTSNSGGKGSERSQGQHNTYQATLFDEAEGVPDFFYSGMKRQFTGNRVKLWVLMANPKTRTSQFQRMKTQVGVKAYRLSLLDFPNVVHGREIVPGGTTRETFNAWLFDYEEFGAHPADGPDDKRYSFQTAWEVTAPDGRVFPPGQWWIPQRGFLYGALGIPPEGGDGDTFVTNSQFEQAVQRSARPKTTDLAKIGLDPARFGKDSGKIYLDLDGNLTLEDTIQGGDTTRYVRGAIRAAERAAEAGYTRLSIRVDAGYGGGVIDALRASLDLAALFSEGVTVHEVHFGGNAHDQLRFADRVTELYASVGDVIGALSITRGGQKLEEDLTDSKFRYVTKNVDDVRREVKQLESKDVFKKRHQGRSRDDGDGFALAVAPERIFITEEVADPVAMLAALAAGAQAGRR